MTWDCCQSSQSLLVGGDHGAAYRSGGAPWIRSIIMVNRTPECLLKSLVDLNRPVSRADIQELLCLLTGSDATERSRHLAWSIVQTRNEVGDQVGRELNLRLTPLADVPLAASLVPLERFPEVIDSFLTRLETPEDLHALVRALVVLSERDALVTWTHFNKPPAFPALILLAESHERTSFTAASLTLSTILWRLQEHLSEDDRGHLVNCLTRAFLEKLQCAKARVTGLLIIHALIQGNLTKTAGVEQLPLSDLEVEPLDIQVAVAHVISAAYGKAKEASSVVSPVLLEYFQGVLRFANKEVTELQGLAADILAKYLYYEYIPAPDKVCGESGDQDRSTLEGLNDIRRHVFRVVKEGLASSKAGTSTKTVLAQALASLASIPTLRDVIANDTLLMRSLLAVVLEKAKARDLHYAFLSTWESLTRMAAAVDQEEREKRQLMATIEAPKAKGDPKPTWDQIFEAESENSVTDRTKKLLRVQTHFNQKVVTILECLVVLSEEIGATQATRELLAHLWFNLSWIQDTRGKMVAFGSVKRLLILREKHRSTTYGVLLAEHTLARIAISVNPHVAFVKDAVSTAVSSALLHLIQTSESQLAQFEGLMALTNLAGLPDAREYIAANGFERIRDLQFTEHTMLRRAGTELLCNLSMTAVAHQYYGGGGFERVKIMILLSGDGVDMPTRLAALGALAILTEDFQVAKVILGCEDSAKLNEILDECLVQDCRLIDQIKLIGRALSIWDNAQRFGFGDRVLTEATKSRIKDFAKNLRASTQADAQWVNSFSQLTELGMSFESFISALVEFSE